MPDAQPRRSPLDGFEAVSGARLSLAPCAPRGQLVLRGDAGSHAFVAGVRSVTGLTLPATPLSSAAAGDFTALWMGPDEWLLLMRDGQQGRVLAELRENLAGEHHAVADVSSSRVGIALYGEAAREVLMKGCSLDLHPREFRAGRVDQSSLARCHVMLHLVDDTPRFEIHVHRSFADYCWRWLADAAAEYGAAA